MKSDFPEHRSGLESSCDCKIGRRRRLSAVIIRWRRIIYGSAEWSYPQDLTPGLHQEAAQLGVIGSSTRPVAA